MVNPGDTVLVTLPTFLTGIGTYGGARQALQSRLQQAGFNVLKLDDSALSYWGALATRGQLLITVVPTGSAYASAQDIAQLVAGAAYTAGYDINAGVSGQVIALAGTGSQSYQNLQNKPPVEPEGDLSKFLDSYGAPLAIGGLALLAIVLLKK